MVEPTNNADSQGYKHQPQVSEKDQNNRGDMQGSKSQPEVSEKDSADGALKDTPERPVTPNVLFYEDDDGQVHIVAEGDQAVAEHDKPDEKRPDPRPKRPDGKVELTRDLAPESTAYALSLIHI